MTLNVSIFGKFIKASKMRVMHVSILAMVLFGSIGACKMHGGPWCAKRFDFALIEPMDCILDP